MTSIALAGLLWLVAVLCFSRSASSSSSNNNNNHNTSTPSQVEAFRSVFTRHFAQTSEKNNRTPLRTLLESTESTITTSSTTSKKKYSPINLFLSAETLETAYRDLAPPFNIMMESSKSSPSDENNSSTANVPQDFSSIVPDANVTHFCFLIHGHRGLSRDLAYFQAVMQRWVSEELKKQQCSSYHQSEQQSRKDCQSQQPAKHKHDMVIHNAVCNEGKTQDGVENGGERLVEEIRQVIDAEMKKRHTELGDASHNSYTSRDNYDGNVNINVNVDNRPDQIYDITISIVGNSLGGLFGRYAIAKLVEGYCVKEVSSVGMSSEMETTAPRWILDGKYRLHLNIFCTTATPHLGVSEHTWVRIPRTAEIGVAHALGQSGKDLFRLNNLLHTMATCPTFLGPLGAFRKRIAYANCYGTDFAVPVGTAAFLSKNSTYPHYFLDDYIVDENGMVIAALQTPVKERNDDDAELEEHCDELHEMSASLDRLGWKKVFVDVRKEMPSVELPKSLGQRLLRQKKQTSDVDNINLSGSNHSRDSLSSTGSDEQSENARSLHVLKKQKVVGSRDIATAVTTPEDNRVALPLGHNMIVAFSRSRFTTFMNKGGRPVVDALAKEIVDGIFTWDGTNEVVSLSNPTATPLRSSDKNGQQTFSSSASPSTVKKER